jgi:hypothetical protein
LGAVIGSSGHNANFGRLSKQTKKMKTVEKLLRFAYQRPGLNPRDYISDYRDIQGRRAYFRESREITNDLQDFKTLFSFATQRIENLEEKLITYLSKNSGRLTLENGNLQYITGQYFPTEYRPAASRVIASLLWDDYREEKNQDGTQVYADGIAIRKAICRNFNRRICKYYFN